MNAHRRPAWILLTIAALVAVAALAIAPAAGARAKRAPIHRRPTAIKICRTIRVRTRGRTHHTRTVRRCVTVRRPVRHPRTRRPGRSPVVHPVSVSSGVSTNTTTTSTSTTPPITTSGYQNAVYSAAAAPDPFVLDSGGVHNDYWAFSTGDLFPVLHSSDLVHWSSAGTAMSSRPSWVLQSGDWHPWSPSVVRLDGFCPPGSTSPGPCYVMFYTGLVPTPGQTPNLTNCIGVATASSAGGPYVDHGPLDLLLGATAGRPLGCGDAISQGNIDPAPFIDDDGQAYLYLSTDFNCSTGTCQLQPTISVIPLTTDLLHALGPRVPLFSGDQPWEQGPAVPTVEGPTMVKHSGLYYLLYSGGNWQSSYAMGYATGPTPLGPFTKHAGNPIMAGTSTVLSPGGGGSPLTGPHGGLWVAYHGRDSSYANPRLLRIDPFSWQAAATPGQPDVAVIAGPTSGPQSTVP